LINTKVNIAKTKAWTKPTKISKPKKGIGANNETNDEITTSRTSPANMFPKRRKAKETTFEISEISSKRPTKVKIGPSLKLKNLVK
jgi:formylmethanofuran dehydrogenase subunit E